MIETYRVRFRYAGANARFARAVLLVAAAVVTTIPSIAADAGSREPKPAETGSAAADGAELDLPPALPRRLPGEAPVEDDPPQAWNPGAVSPVGPGAGGEREAITDRWGLIETLGVRHRWWDPYNQNRWKGDRPVAGEWFVNMSVISNTLFEPSGLAGFDSLEQRRLDQRLTLGISLVRGDTAFKPPDLEIRLSPVLSRNRRSFDRPGGGTDDLTDRHVGWQEAFATVHVRDVSANYDFDAVRVGIQPWSGDFRGYVLRDQPFGVRLFGNRRANRVQYNLAWFRRFERDESGAYNDLTRGLLDEDLFVANVYSQDTPVPGFTSQGSVVYARNREESGSLRGFDAVWVGYSGDGHLGRLNLSGSVHGVRGRTRGVPGTPDRDIEGWLLALEPSVDRSWLRVRGTLLLTSGDGDPRDGTSSGYDALSESPLLAGSDAGFWIGQRLRLEDASSTVLVQRDGLLPSLRSGDASSPSNFDNPGLRMIGGGVDLDLFPQLRLSVNANRIRFAETSSLRALLGRDVDSDLGHEWTWEAVWRPYMNQNLLVRFSTSVLILGDGGQDLFGVGDDRLSALKANVVLGY